MNHNTGVSPSRGAARGEAVAPREHTPCPSWGAVKRHRKAGEPLCPDCRELHRSYYREYERTRRQSSVERARRVEANQRWRDRNRAALRDYARRYYRQQVAALRNYVDPVVVDRLVRGEPASCSRRERLAAVGLLRERGSSYSVIAARLGVSERQVHRDLRDLGMVKAA